MTARTTTASRAVTRVASAVGVLAVALLAACSNGTTSSANNGTIAVQLTDAVFATDSVRSVDVFVVRVDTRMSDADSATAAKGASDDSVSTGGWTTLARPNQSVNLLAYQNGATLNLGSTSVPAGSYLGFRLVIDPSRSSLTLKNGAVLTSTSTPSVSFPSASRSGIKIVLAQAVKVTSDQTTTVLVDFDLLNSFVMKGNSIGLNGLTFKPVIKASVK